MNRLFVPSRTNPPAFLKRALVVRIVATCLAVGYYKMRSARWQCRRFANCNDIT